MQKTLLATLFVIVSVVSARAVDPNQPDSNYLRTHFSSDNGLPAPVVDQTVQTKDGFLWLILNGNNLIRFDGKNYYRFHQPRPTTMAAAPDGDLWVGSDEGLIRIPSSNLNQVTFSNLVSYHPAPGPASRITCLRFSRAGVLLVGTAAGLFRYEGNQFVAVGPRVSISQIEEAPNGNLLFTTEQGFMELAGSELVLHPGLAAQLGVKDSEIFYVLRDRQGNTWYCTALGVARETNGRIEKLGTYARFGHAAVRAHEDMHGTVWFAKDEGLFRATSAGLELMAAGMQVRFLYSDRDGALWVSTNGDGLYRFKERTVRMFTTKDGLPNDVIKTVLATHDGTIWAGAYCGGLARFDGTRFRTYNEKDGLINTCIFALAEDLNGDLWIATRGGDGVFRYHNGSFTQYKKNQGLPDDRVRTIIVARDGSVWFGTGSGLARLKNEKFRTFTTADGLSSDQILRVWEDRSGVIWAGSKQGLDRLVGDRFEKVVSSPNGLIIPIGDDRDGGFYYQIEIDAEAITRRLYKDRTDDIKQIAASDTVETEQGELWFAGDGFGRMQPGNFTHTRG